MHSVLGAAVAAVAVVFAASSAPAHPYVVGSSQPFGERTWQRHAPTRRRSDSNGSRTNLGRVYGMVEVIRRQYVDVVECFQSLNPTEK